MIQVIIVDDEVISRVGIRNLLNWESEGYSLSAVCENGLEAMTYMESHPVDIVITDIKMPVMNGLELMKCAMEKGLQCKFILLSAFDDFVYVRQALTMGASDYLRKLELDEQGLRDALNRAKLELGSLASLHPLDHGLDVKKQTYIKNAMLKELLYGHRAGDEGYMKELEANGVVFPYPFYYVMLFAVKDTVSESENQNIIQMLEEAVADIACAQVTWTSVNEIAVLFNVDGDIEEHHLKAEIIRWSNRIQFIMKQYFNQQTVIYVSKPHNGLVKLALAYQEARQAKSFGFVSDSENTVFFNETIANRERSANVFMRGYLKKFNEALRLNSKEHMLIVLDEMIAYIESAHSIESHEIGEIFSTMITKFNLFLDFKELRHSVLNEAELLPQLSWHDGLTISDGIDFLQRFKAKIDSILGNSEGNFIVKQAKEYIKLHYKETINMQELAGKLFVTSNYLSALFKKVTGETLKDYAIQLRIEKAKQLLRNSNAQIAEIATETGYDNEQYFCRIFKKKVNMTPTQFRNNDKT